MQSTLINSMNYVQFFDDVERIIKRTIKEELAAALQANTNSTTTSKIPTLLTADELSKWLNVSKISLWRYEKQGKLTPLKIGKKKVYDVEEIKANLQGGLND